ncbi:MAG: PQQ-binding-like beta-propeller repeat protein [Treponema sp.]|jgi:outer membrane protein assembly factor BamB|nr:PQQ-binding-like beta-propeller repeat protein [Treponema sp.]
MARHKRLPGVLFLGAFLVSGLWAQTGDKPQDTSPLWRQALGGAVTGIPATQAESVVVVCDGGNLKAYSRQGRFLWDYFARGRLGPFITRSREGTSYVCRTNGTLIAVNRSGRELWRVSASPLTAPVLAGWDGRIFVPMDKKLSCYTAAGYLLWSRTFSHPMTLGPVPDTRGGLLTVLENGELLRIDAFGKVRSQQLPSVPAAALPLEAPDAADVPPSVLILYKNGGMELSGEGQGTRPLPALGGSPLAAVSRGDAAAVTLTNGQVLLVSGAGGEVLRIGQSHIEAGEAPGETAMLYDERGIYVLSASGAAGFTGDGRRLWLLRLRGSAAVPAFSDEGILYSGGSDWILYAYRLEERVRAQRRSIYGPAPEGSYGTGNPPPSPWADYYFRFDEGEIKTQLETIEGAIREGRVGEDEKSFVAYLMEIAGSPGNTPAAAASLHPPVQAGQRVEALRLLAYLGSRETIPFLAALFYRDREPLVRAAAAAAIGRIGVDPEGTALRAFTAAVSSPSPLRDEQVLVSVAAAAGALCRFSGPPLSDAGVKLLVVLAGKDRPQLVQRAARRELDSLRGEREESVKSWE